MELLGLQPRRVGTAMVWFGALGVVLAGVIAVSLVGTAIAARDLDERLVADQARLAETVDELATTTGSVATSLDNASATIEASSTAVLHARDVLDELAATSDELASSLNISILGNQPFAGAAARFRDLAERVRVFRDDATVIAERLATNAEDMDALSVRVDAMEARLADYAERIAGSTRIGAIGTWIAFGVLLGGLLAAWLAIAAAACAWVGWRLRTG
jgi:tetrahydromethanopterin S-methyltransferase subunit B